MISQLPRWVEYGAFLLALVAGTVNAVGLLGFEHQSVSHLSGTATLLGGRLLSSPWSDSVHLLGILIAFLIGATISGMLLRGKSLKLGKHYDSALVVEGVLLLVALAFLSQNNTWGHFFASAACGLQNAFATTFSGAIVRTTHVTGIFTDLGIMLGAWLRGEELDRRKAQLFLLIISGFIAGGALGVFLFLHWQFLALLFPAGVCFILAFVYRWFLRQQEVSAES